MEELENKRRKIKKGANVVTTILLIFSIFFFAFVLHSVRSLEEGEHLTIFGYQPVLILTNSMDPEIKKYGLVLLKDCTYEEVEVGDTIAFTVVDSEGSKDIVHKVIDITDEGIQTQGVNNPEPDPYIVTEDMVYAKVVWSTNILNTIYYNLHIIIPIFIFIIGFILCFYAIRRIRKE